MHPELDEKLEVHCPQIPKELPTQCLSIDVRFHARTQRGVVDNFLFNQRWNRN